MQLYEQARRRLAEIDRTFMEMVTHPKAPLTRAELERLIQRRPELWGRFEHWLKVLS
jgi:hypothetical protein